MFKLQNNLDNDNRNEEKNPPISLIKDTVNPKLATSLSLNTTKGVPDNDENEFLKNFIEIPKDQLDQLQKNDFIRYRMKTDGELKKGGYIVDIYTRVLKNGEEKSYIKLSFNKTFINTNRVGTYQVSIENIDKLYKKIQNQVEYNIMSNGINGISENFGSDINNIYELFRNKDLEIASLKEEVNDLKKDNIKTEQRLKKIVEFIKELGDRTSNPKK